MHKLEGDYMVQPVVKALQVLDYVARQGHMVTLTEIVHELRLPKTTVFRYLQTLSATGFLAHDVWHDRYGTGANFRELARIDHELSGLRELAQPEMRQLVDAFNETVNLAILDDSDIVYIDMLEPPRPLRASARIGLRHPAHSTSLGKAMLAFMPEVVDRMPGGELEQMTIKTLTEVSKLRRQSEDVRRRGYALEVGENEDGLMCIGVPILDRAGHPVAAMSMSAPERRMRPERTSEAAEALKGAASRISQQLAA